MRKRGEQRFDHHRSVTCLRLAADSSSNAFSWCAVDRDLRRVVDHERSDDEGDDRERYLEAC